MDTEDAVKGLLSCAFAVITFGSFFVPIKKYNPGDGIYVQWVMSVAILMVGFVIFAYEGFPKFYPVSMIGGALWTIGNAMTIPVIEVLGLPVLMLLGDLFNGVVCWATSYFGLFVVVGCILVTFIEGDSQKVEDKAGTAKFSKKSTKRRLIAILMALASGVFYGVEQTPIIAIQDNPQIFGADTPQTSLPYLFGHFLGIFMVSSVIFVIYCFIKKNRLFYATNKLSLAITGPLIAMVPASIAALWSVFISKKSKELKTFSIYVLPLA
uniref:Transmembrane protein 144 n=1 Tax=Ditylenchus dipsaci TaxID=166011 RepID=A0A915DFW9_9BILA